MTWVLIKVEKLSMPNKTDYGNACMQATIKGYDDKSANRVAAL